MLWIKVGLFLERMIRHTAGKSSQNMTFHIISFFLIFRHMKIRVDHNIEILENVVTFELIEKSKV